MTTRRDFIKIVGPARGRRRGARGRRPLGCWCASAAPARIPTSTTASSIRGSWSAADNTATFFVGKTDLGQGTGTAFRQLMADELDMAYDRTSW